MTKENIQKHVVTSGDTAMVAAGGTAFTRSGNRVVWNVAPGQLIAYVLENGTTRTVDHTTLAASDLHKLFVGVGFYDKHKKRTVIRHLGMPNISGCIINEAGVSSPRCGNPEVEDFMFGCVRCGDTYTVAVGVDDNFNRSFAPWNKSYAEYIAAFTPDCNQDCSDCPGETTCGAVADGLVAALRDDYDLTLDGRPYPDWKKQQIERPFEVMKLHNRSLVYCLALEGDACEDCDAVAALRGYGVNAATAVAFTGHLNPADNTQTLRSQLQGIVEQINAAFEASTAHNGYAYLTGSNPSGNCCPLQLHINTDDPDFLIYSDAGLTAELDPTTDVDPFTGTSFTCGIRVISAPIEGDAGCYIEKPLGFYNRQVRILPASDSWKNGQTKRVKVQKMETPANFGNWIKWLEMQSDIGGNFQSDRSNQMRGWLNLPEGNARVNLATADGGKDYCSYYLQTEVDKKNHADERSFTKINSYVHIPSDDSTTLTAWENFLNALIGLTPQCRVLSSVTCSPLSGGCA